ncbi:hypothetical protein ABZV31_09755 [Streptomyces sp. NPDC005202]|uniref:hypothetical protein n=1 Tax=Streptomyces sp. NPDC005202 TaxID=3157021 RepID=UPI0033AEB399
MNQASWVTAALRLLEDVYAFAATGPRAHPDWQRDVLAVMNRAVDDPRGWRTLDWDKENDEQRAASGPSFPFFSLSREALTERLFPVPAETAARLLVVMTHDWGPVDPEEDVTHALTDARTLLDRYGEDISCYSNITKARVSPSPDLAAGVTDWRPLTQYDGDYGIVVVSPEEVGVFWSFNPV